MRRFAPSDEASRAKVANEQNDQQGDKSCRLCRKNIYGVGQKKQYMYNKT